MNAVPTVIVRKGGFLSALFHGLFGFLTALVICASGLGVYALHVADGKIAGFLSITREVVAGLPQWQQNLPPLLAETLDDRRAPEYRGQVDISVEKVTSPEGPGVDQTLVEVANRGSETISMLALNIVLEDRNGVPVRERRVYAASPLALDAAEWRGLLFPGDVRRFVVRCCGAAPGLQPTAQITELRVWNGPRADHPAVAAQTDVTPQVEVSPQAEVAHSAEIASGAQSD
jgi:hypothetical protein